MMLRLLLPALAAIALWACSERDDGAAPDISATPEASLAPGAPPGEPAAAAPAGGTVGATIGGDGSPLELVALAPEDVEGLDGELACSFTPEVADGRAHLPILIARANVAPAERSFAVVKIGGYVETMSSRATGGYDAMVDGAGYGGRGLTVDVTRLSEDNLNANGEGLQYPATLRADRADGARRTWHGVWSCGP